MAEFMSQRQRYLKRWGALKNEQQTWLDHWRELSDHIQPRRSRFLTTDRNKSRRNDKIINNAPLRASRILASGMMSGLTSPARPWFRLTTADTALAEQGAVKAWLQHVEERLRLVFARSNIYGCLARVYADLAVFGTAALHVDEDPEDVIRGYVYPIGQYALAANARGQVDTVYRELSMTVGQLVERFGLQACSRHTRTAYERGDLDQWRDVLHVIEPNRALQHGKAGPAGMRFKSCWLEMGCGDDEGFLSESGYEEMPTLCPRWEVNGEDVYGHGPGMVALGSAQELQKMAKEQRNILGKIVRPPMNVPSTISGRRFSLLEGDVNWVDQSTAGMKAEPSIVVPHAAAAEAREAAREYAQMVAEAFFADLWLMLASNDGDKTAEEVRRLHEEKMIQLGPVYDNLGDMLLDPLMDRTFAIALRAGEIPPPPEELQGADLRVEYISPIAQAQKLIGVTSIERHVGFVISVAQARADALDNLAVDDIVRAHADAVGVPPKLGMSPEQVQAIRQERARQQQAQAQAEAAAQEAATAKDLAQSTVTPDSVLGRLLAANGVAPAMAGV